ncbi:MAG: NADH-quinone oxidoreductase subunit L [Cyclobacteriaceae bacterium]|nr:NADH-quinone oxidoreductase subunit L [Cyclobacteriaceae bacterium]
MEDYLLALILLLPLLGGIIAYTIPSKSGIIASIFLSLTTILAGYYLSFVQGPLWMFQFEWLPGFVMGFAVDRSSAVLILLVSFISFLVHLFSIFYLSEDVHKDRYYLKLGFFTFSMLGLLMSDHLILLFIFWELVGFSSYLLIIFWFQDVKNAIAGRIAFMTSRISDLILFMGLLMLLGFGNDGFISSLGPLPENDSSTVIGICLLIGVLGKSAQFPFFTWLPHAMVGPTPISALIHAATMVAAGVYLLFRLYIVFDPYLLDWIASLGIITAFLGALIAACQTDMKAVLAYSTISQLGYMVMGMGVGAYDMALFHLWTHAFFKAGLFLCAGSVIHYLSIQDPTTAPQDMRRMGGLKSYLPITFWSYLVCMMALVGLPFFSGFLSKEGIILGVFSWAMQSENGLAFALPITALGISFLTAYYMGKQLLLVFFGSYRGEKSLKMLQKSWTEILPISVLAILSLGVFYRIHPLGGDLSFLEYWLGTQPKAEGSWVTPMIGSSILLVLLGLGFSYWKYGRQGMRKVKSFNSSRLSIFVQNGFYLDKFYMGILVPSFDWLAFKTSKLDTVLINPFFNKISVSIVVLSKVTDLFDRLIVDGLISLIKSVVQILGSMFTKFHPARVQMHFVSAIIGLVIILVWLKFAL